MTKGHKRVLEAMRRFMEDGPKRTNEIRAYLNKVNRNGVSTGQITNLLSRRPKLFTRLEEGRSSWKQNSQVWKNALWELKQEEA